MAAFYKEGLHVGECIGQFMGQSDNDKKTPYVALKFKIVARVENDQEYGVDPGERTIYLYLSEGALPMTTEVLAFLGFDKDSVKYLNPEQQGFFDFTGQRRDLWCKIEEYQGKSKEKWNISTPRKAATPIDDKELRRLDSLFGKAIRAQRGPSVPAAAPAPPAATSTLERTEKGEIAGVSDQQRGAGRRSNAAAPPTPDEIPF